MTRTKSFDSVQIAVRVPASLLQEADALARQLHSEAVPVTRSDALRMALRLGMQRIAESYGKAVALPSDAPE